MTETSSARENRRLWQQGFDMLLTRLDVDREVAGLKYEIVRRKLTKFLAWRGAKDAEELADEAIDRVATKLATGNAIEDISAYLVGVARLVFKEHVRDHVKIRAVVEQEARDRAPTEREEERHMRLGCYEQCLSSLTSENRELIIKYYQTEQSKKAKQRNALSAQLQMPLNLLRVRAFRVRKKLGECLDKCLKNRRGEM